MEDSAVVPAQITTVEDRIFGRLAPHQFVLIFAPICFGFMAFAVFPPNFHLVFYKLCITLVLEIIGAALSVRVRGKILLLWLIVILRYNLRPQFYIYNKNDPYLRDMTTTEITDEAETVAEQPVTRVVHSVDLRKAVKIRGIMADPRANLKYVARKDGKLHAVISEIK